MAIAARDDNGVPVNLIKDPVSGAAKEWAGDVGVSGFSTELPMGPVTSVSGTASVLGDTVVVTPSSGKALRVYYLSMNADGGNTADVTAYFRFGAAGAAKYKKSLKAGAIFARAIGGGRKYIQGAMDEPLYINLSAAQTVNWDVEYDEV
jgi:hypothetical protein